MEGTSWVDGGGRGRIGHGNGYWGDGTAITSSYEGCDLIGRNNVGNKYATSDQNADPTLGTAIVGSYAPNTWGLYDMNGNVWEFCLDWYEADITAQEGAVNIDASDATKTRSGATGSTRVIRGGAWNVAPKHSRPARRDPFSASERGANSVGFRLCCPAELPAEPELRKTALGFLFHFVDLPCLSEETIAKHRVELKTLMASRQHHPFSYGTILWLDNTDPESTLSFRRSGYHSRAYTCVFRFEKEAGDVHVTHPDTVPRPKSSVYRKENSPYRVDRAFTFPFSDDGFVIVCEGPDFG